MKALTLLDLMEIELKEFHLEKLTELAAYRDHSHGLVGQLWLIPNMVQEVMVVVNVMPVDNTDLLVERCFQVTNQKVMNLIPLIV